MMNVGSGISEDDSVVGIRGTVRGLIVRTIGIKDIGGGMNVLGCGAGSQEEGKDKEGLGVGGSGVNELALGMGKDRGSGIRYNYGSTLIYIFHGESNITKREATQI